MADGPQKRSSLPVPTWTDSCVPTSLPAAAAVPTRSRGCGSTASFTRIRHAHHRDVLLHRIRRRRTLPISCTSRARTTLLEKSNSRRTYLQPRPPRR